jgi:hypothetical protein
MFFVLYETFRFFSYLQSQTTPPRSMYIFIKAMYGFDVGLYLGEQISRESKRGGSKKSSHIQAFHKGISISRVLEQSLMASKTGICQKPSDLGEQELFWGGVVIDRSWREGSSSDGLNDEDQDAKEVELMLYGTLERKCEVSGDPSIAV